MNTQKVAYTVREFAAASGISRTQLFAYIRLRRLKARRCGKKLLILAEDAAEFLQNLPEREAAARLKQIPPNGLAGTSGGGALAVGTSALERRNGRATVGCEIYAKGLAGADGPDPTRIGAAAAEPQSDRHDPCRPCRVGSHQRHRPAQPCRANFPLRRQARAATGPRRPVSPFRTAPTHRRTTATAALVLIFTTPARWRAP